MPSLRALVDFVTGERVTAQRLNDMTKYAFHDFVLYKPVCHIYGTSTNSLTTGTVVTLTLNAAKIETYSGMANVANNRINITHPGLYRITAQATFAVNNSPSGTNYRYSAIVKNGTTGIATQTVAGSTGTINRLNYGAVERLAEGDYLILQAAQTSGATLTTDTGTGGCYLSAEWVAA